MKKIVIKFVCSHLRKDLSKKPPEPIVRSQFTQYLWDRATWRDEE